MHPLAVGDRVLVQNQTVIVECKPHDQINVMMDGSRKVSLRNRQFVRKINVPMPAASSGVKPSQLQNSHHDDVPDVQNRHGEDLSGDRYLRAMIGVTQLLVMQG